MHARISAKLMLTKTSKSPRRRLELTLLSPMMVKSLKYQLYRKRTLLMSAFPQKRMTRN